LTGLAILHQQLPLTTDGRPGRTYHLVTLRGHEFVLHAIEDLLAFSQGQVDIAGLGQLGIALDDLHSMAAGPDPRVHGLNGHQHAHREALVG
jgi:hypothetical protein